MIHRNSPYDWGLGFCCIKVPKKETDLWDCATGSGAEQVNNVAEGEIKQLTDQFYITLRAYFGQMPSARRKAHPGRPTTPEDLLNPDRPRSWSEAYEIEQLLVHLFDEETLKTELDVRSLEARRTFHPLY